MQPSQPETNQVSRFVPGRVVVTASPDRLDQLQQHTEVEGQVGQHLGTPLTLKLLHENAPNIYHHDGQSWQKADPALEPTGHDLLTMAGQLAGQAALNEAFQQAKTSRETVTRSYHFDPESVPTDEVSDKLSELLNNPNELGITGFDITPDHIVTHASGSHTDGSPWKIPARTGVADPTTHAEPESLFREQNCWEAIGAAERAAFQHKGEGVTVVILDTAPELARISHDLVDFVIPMKTTGSEFDQPLPSLPGMSLKDIYSIRRVNPPEPVRPGGDDINAGLMETYHGVMVASLIRELAPAAKIVLVEVLDETGGTTGSNVVEALDYVQFLQDHKATIDGQRVIEDKLVFNLSLGLPRSLSEDVDAVYLLEACQRLCEDGALIVAAAGNDSYYMHPSNPEEPAAYGYFLDNETVYDQVIAVSSTGPNANQYSLYSNQGNMAAPGMDLLMDTGDPANPGGTRYVYWAGTSFAAPLVTASSAILLSAGVAVKDVKQTLWDGATQPRRWQDTAELHLGRTLENLAARPTAEAASVPATA